MSMDPSTIQQMLMQGLQQPGSAGGGAGGPAMRGSTTPVNAAAQLAQKAMLIRALQNAQQRQQQVQATAMLPQTQAMMNQTPLPNPNMPPPPGLPPVPGAPVDPSMLPIQ